MKPFSTDKEVCARILMSAGAWGPWLNLGHAQRSSQVTSHWTPMLSWQNGLIFCQVGQKISSWKQNEHAHASRIFESVSMLPFQWKTVLRRTYWVPPICSMVLDALYLLLWSTCQACHVRIIFPFVKLKLRLETSNNSTMASQLARVKSHVCTNLEMLWIYTILLLVFVFCC